MDTGHLQKKRLGTELRVSGRVSLGRAGQWEKASPTFQSPLQEYFFMHDIDTPRGSTLCTVFCCAGALPPAIAQHRIHIDQRRLVPSHRAAKSEGTSCYGAVHGAPSDRRGSGFMESFSMDCYLWLPPVLLFCVCYWGRPKVSPGASNRHRTFQDATARRR